MIHIKEFMSNNNLTIRKLARLTHISKSTLSYQMKRPLKSWHYGLLEDLAKITNTKLSQVVHELRDGGWHLNFDDKKHTLQGVYLGSYLSYLKTKDVVINEYFEGWQPNSDDIKVLKHSINHPNKIARKALAYYINQAKKEGVYLGK